MSAPECAYDIAQEEKIGLRHKHVVQRCALIDALERAGCERISKDMMSGAKTERPELHEALEQLRTRDILVEWRLDRLGRTLKQLIELLNDLNSREVGFRSS